MENVHDVNHLVQKSKNLLRFLFNEPQHDLPVKKSSAASLWQKMAENSSVLAHDPWVEMVDDVVTERAVEHLYDVHSNSWTSKSVLVKIDADTAVASGAMRECFKLKKIETSPDLMYLSSASQKIQAWYDIENMLAHEVLAGLGKSTAARISAQLGNGKPLRLGFLVSELSKNLDHTERIIKECMFDKFHVDNVLSELHKLRSLEQLNRRKWSLASTNFMAKRYFVKDDSKAVTDGNHKLEDINDPSKVYRDDVEMQEISKLLAEQYNRQELPPPKEIDMLHVGVLELIDRPGKPFYGYESYIPGDYHKWNTNAGWIDSENIRHTPNAFSFFTFRHTKGDYMVVDVQFSWEGSSFEALIW